MNYHQFKKDNEIIKATSSQGSYSFFATPLNIAYIMRKFLGQKISNLIAKLCMINLDKKWLKFSLQLFFDSFKMRVSVTKELFRG